MTDYAHQLPESFALEDLSDLGAHSRQLGVLCNDLIENGWIGHDTGHLLKELRRVHHRLELWSEVKKLKLKNA
jgi:hypothetical protein